MCAGVLSLVLSFNVWHYGKLHIGLIFKVLFTKFSKRNIPASHSIPCCNARSDTSIGLFSTDILFKISKIKQAGTKTVQHSHVLEIYQIAKLALGP